MLDFEKINNVFEKYNIYKSIFIYSDEYEKALYTDYLTHNLFSYVNYNNLFNFDDYFKTSLERILIISYEEWFLNKVYIKENLSHNNNLIVIGEIMNENIDLIYKWITFNNYILELSDEII